MPREAKHPRNSPQVNVKLTPAENTMLDWLASSLGVPRSEAMRRCLVARAASEAADLVGAPKAGQ